MPPHGTAPRMGAPEWIALLALSTLWGGSFFFYKVLVAELPPFTVVPGGVSIAALALHLLLPGSALALGLFFSGRRSPCGP